MLYNLQNKKTVLDQIKTDTVKAVNLETSIDYLTEKINNLEETISQVGEAIRYNEETEYVQVYYDGEWYNWKKVSGPTKVEAKDGATYKGIVYLDPTDLTKTCKASNSVSTTETKTGCMKWYIYAEDSSSYTMILDHNTTALVAWNSTGSNSSMNEIATVLTALKNTSGWKVTARLITADEIATITGNTTFKGSTSTSSDWFFFEQNSTNKNKYAWLYDYTNGCSSYKCNIEDNNKYVYDGTNSNNTWGYWTSTPVAGSTEYAWGVFVSGNLDATTRVSVPSAYGVRPVVTVSKDIFE
jgi:hypothetical protein